MHNTGYDVPSNSVLDFEDNCENLDSLLNVDQEYWTDRLGVKHPTIDYILKSAGFVPAGFDFTSGGVLMNGDRNKCVFNQPDQTWYNWSGDLPYNVTPGSAPEEGWKVVSRPTSNTISLESLGLKQGGIINNFIAPAEALASSGFIITCGNIEVVTSAPIQLVKNDLTWILNCTIDGKDNTSTQINIVGKNISLTRPKFKNGQFYDIYATNTSENCKIFNCFSKDCKYTSFFDSGKNNLWEDLIAIDPGWDLASTLEADQSHWKRCNVLRPKRHGYSTDPGTKRVTFEDCVCIDNGGWLNEGSDAFHAEDDTTYSDKAIVNFIRCKAVYTDNHRVMTDPTYVGLVRAIRTENTYLTVFDGIEITAEPGIKEKLKNNEIILFGSSLITQTETLLHKTIVTNLKLNFGIVALQAQEVILRSPSGYFKIVKLGISGKINLYDPQLDGNGNTQPGVLFSVKGGLAVRECHIYNGSVKNFNSIVDRVCLNCVFDTTLENITNPYKFQPDSSDAGIKTFNTILSGKVLGNTTTFLEEGYQDNDGVIVKGISFQGLITTLRSGFFSSSKWYGCDGDKATITTLEDVTRGGAKLDINSKCKSSHDAIFSATTVNPITDNVIPYSFGSTLLSPAHGYFVATGILPGNWTKVIVI